MADVFVSYSRRDAEFVMRLADDLKGRGKDVWVDVEGIRDAEMFPVALRRAIEGADAFVFVISPDSVSSAFCDQEVAHASELNKRIVPLALREVPDEQIPEQIRYRNWIPVDGEFTADVDRIVAAIDTDLGWEQEHTRVTVRALQWEEGGGDRSFLLRGAELASAERWLAAGADKDPGPTALEQEYLLAARQAASRRQRTLVGGSLTVAIVAIALLIFALISRGQAVSAETSARSQDLAAESGVQQTVDAERAVLLAADAVRTRVSYGANGTMFALRAAIDASAIRYRLPNARTQGCGGPGVVYDPAPHSDLLAEGLCTGQIRFANASTGRIERTARLGSGAAILLGYTSSGSALVDAAGVRLLKLDPLTGAVRARSPVVPGLTTFGIDPRAPIVAAVGAEQLDFWNTTTGRLKVIRPRQGQMFGHPNALSFSPNARRVVITFDSSSGGPGMIIVDVASGRIVGSLPTSSSAVAYSPSGRELAVGQVLPAGGSIVMLNATTLKTDHGFHSVPDADVEPTAVAFSPDGSQLAYGFADGTAGLLSAATGQALESYSGDNALITAISFRPDGQLVATGSQDGTVRAWRAGGLTLGTARAGTYLSDVAPYPGGFVTLANPGSRPGQGVVAQRWLDDGRPVDRPLVMSRTPNVDALFLAPGGQVAVMIIGPNLNASRGRVEVWNVAQRRVVRSVALQLPEGSEPVISPNGNLIAMTEQAPFKPPVSRYDLDVLNLITGRQRVLTTEAACGAGWRGFAFNPSSTLLAAGTFCGTDVRVWNLATGKPAGAKLDLNGGELAWMAFSPDARHVAIASWNGTIEVSPVPVTGRVTSLTENTKGAPMVAYSPDGRYLASAGLDHTVRIFDAHSLSELRVIAQPDATDGIAFTDDSQEVLSWGTDNTARLWDACTDCENPTALLALTRSRVTRDLTPQERTEFGVN
jgi:WD40 repeat protein